MADVLEKDSPTNFTANAGLGTGPVSTEGYRSKEYFEQESEKVFRRAWLCLGRVEQLNTPGSYFVQEIEIAKVSILVTRDSSDKIRAFYNVCSHRSNKLVLSKSGSGNVFTCSYHNWAYKNDGSLIGVPDQRNFFDLDKKKCGLTSVACELWEGWIFINLQREPEVSLREFLSPAMMSDLADIPFKHTSSFIEYDSEIGANWKVLADAFAETYHIPALHSKSLGPTFSSKDNPHARPIHTRTWGAHRSLSGYGNPEYQIPERAIVERLAYSASKTGNTLSADDLDATTDLRDHPAINPSGAGTWAVDLVWIFPHFHFHISPGGFWTHHFWPLAHDRTRWVARFHVPEPTSIRQRFQQEQFIARLTDILLEDVGNSERMQEGLNSGVKAVMHLQDGEMLIRHSIHHLNKWIGSATVKEAISES
ncbi:MAG: aromatic ring-hydroxylating dioxygenase subunit alpha [Sphingomonadaceae bacterium]